jgi:RNA polymerase sigma factor (sigma-70 family)
MEVIMNKEDTLNTLGGDLRKIEKDYKKMIEPYRSDLWNYCYKLTKSPWDAEDLVQETLLKSLSILTKVFQELNTKSYLFRIATNLWIDQHRKRKLNVIDSYHIESVNDSVSTYEFDVMEHLEFLAQHLTAKQYVAFILAEVFQFKATEVGGIIGATQASVYANLNRAREALIEIKNQAEGSNDLLKNQNVKDIKEKSETVKTLLEGFRKKDPAIIASILDENIITDITHAGIEFGKDETIKNSLNDWKHVVLQQGEIITLYKLLWGRPVIIELESRENELYLNNIHYIEEEEGKVVFWKFYCFSWELINISARELNVKLNAKYFQNVY